MNTGATGRAVEPVTQRRRQGSWLTLIMVGLHLMTGMVGTAHGAGKGADAGADTGADAGADAGDGRLDVTVVPRPDFGDTDPVIRRELEQWHSAFDSARERWRQQPSTLQPEELAIASGQLGELYHAHQFHLAAEVAYQNARRLAPSEARWAYDAGILHQDLGALEASLASFADVLASEPSDLPSLIRSGELLLQLDRPREAGQHFELVLEPSPVSAAALAGLGKVASAEAEFEAAVKYFRQALEIQPQATAIHYPLAVALRQLGDLEGAKRHLELRGEVDVAFQDPRLDHLARIAKVSAANVLLAQVESADVSPRELLGFAVAHLGETPGAAEFLTTAFKKLETERGGLSLTTWARFHYVTGGLLIVQESDEEALRHLQAALELPSGNEPVVMAALFDAAGVLVRRGRREEAVEYYNQVLAKRPDSTQALTGRAMARIQLGRETEAIPDLRRLAALEPDRGAPRLHLGMVHQRLGRPAEAFEHYRAALDLQLDATEQALVRGNLATLAIDRGEFTVAVEELEQAVALDPDATTLTLRLADTLGLANRFAEATRHYAAVVERLPNHPEARVGEVSALIFDQRYEEAGTRLEAAVVALPDNRQLKLLLARFLAVSPVDTLRDGKRSLDLARDLFKWRQTVLHGETLAMALAQVGRFLEAVDIQSGLLQATEQRGSPRAAERLRGNLERYRAGRRCCAQDVYVVLLPTPEPTLDS